MSDRSNSFNTRLGVLQTYNVEHLKMYVYIYQYIYEWRPRKDLKRVFTISKQVITILYGSYVFISTLWLNKSLYKDSNISV